MNNFKALSLPLLDETLEPFRKLSASPPTAGWVRAIREALGMTKEQLARRLDVSASTISTLERSEARETITLKSLQRLAQGLDCRVVYALVPKDGKTLEGLVREQAEAVASKQMKRVSHTMRLEDQSLSERQEKRQRERIVQSLLSGSRRRLWR